MALQRRGDDNPSSNGDVPAADQFEVRCTCPICGFTNMRKPVYKEEIEDTEKDLQDAHDPKGCTATLEFTVTIIT